MKMEIKGAVPCSVCGEYPVLQGGYGDQQHTARLVCPNYKSETLLHGNCSYDTQHLPRGFTSWHYEDWWTEEQAETIGLSKLVSVWNIIHGNKRGECDETKTNTNKSK